MFRTTAPVPYGARDGGYLEHGLGILLVGDSTRKKNYELAGWNPNVSGLKKAPLCWVAPAENYAWSAGVFSFMGVGPTGTTTNRPKP